MMQALDLLGGIVVDKFKFEVNDVFCIVARGLVFRGNVIEGNLVTNQAVKFKSGGVEYTALVSFIELNRKIVKETIHGQEMGLMLTGFNVEEINDFYINAPSDEGQEDYPSIKEILKIEYPIIIES